MKKIRIILIEDNRLLREGIYALLRKERDLNVVASYGGSELYIDNFSKLKPDIVLLDLGLANRNSFELVKLLKLKFPGIYIIVMDLVAIHEDLLRFVEAGVSGFILKDAKIAEFKKTIRKVAHGEKVLPAIMTGSLFSQIMDYGIKKMGPSELARSVRMTKREREIIKLIADGLSNKEIAYKLSISIYTVKSHVHNILEKMTLNTRVQIAIHARGISNGKR